MNIMQRCWYISVQDQGQTGFMAETRYMDTSKDVTLSLEVERKSLLIRKNSIEVNRGDLGEAANAPTGSLEGITAYFGSGKQLRNALKEFPFLLEMAVHAVTAVIQSEVFFYQERGFSSASLYDDFWDEKYKDSCVYYSNLNRVRNRFMDNIEDYNPGKVLFHRVLLTTLDASHDNTRVHGHLMDTFHEMTLSLELEKDHKIKNVSAYMLRCPDSVCLEAITALDGLKDLVLNSEPLKEYQRTCELRVSCTHMAQLVQEAARTMELYLKQD